MPPTRATSPPRSEQLIGYFSIPELEQCYSWRHTIAHFVSSVAHSSLCALNQCAVYSLISTSSGFPEAYRLHFVYRICLYSLISRASTVLSSLASC